MVDGAVDRAGICMRRILTANLYGGIRNRDALTGSAVSVCEPELVAFLEHFVPETDRAMVHSSMIKEAHRQIDQIIANGE
jgi:hypothetical protein